MFSVHTTPEELKTQQLPVSSDLCLRRPRSGIIIVALSFTKSSVFDETPAFSNSSGLKSVFIKLRFRDGLVRTAGFTVEVITREREQRVNARIFLTSA